MGPVLIANRGEIAVRIARSVHARGRTVVGVYTDADIDALHVDTADVAVRIDSYLEPAAVVAAALSAGAEAVHPGYGFLAENAFFARAVIDAGLTWVGPPPEAIELMGDKGRAKEAAAAAGVPVVPSGDESGYPVIVKAVAGGGGKGMRIAHSADELEAATAAAQREAKAAFGDDRVLVERYVERPRHIEIQVLADKHGNCVHFGERECSLQRRHQKVVEEAPSPVIDSERRERMGSTAVELALACGYEGAGTVEFITTPDGGEFFFLEMNTRLQVEHPVTELVYGVDLVEEQLRIAAGEKLRFEQASIKPRGHAVETRLYAEDPSAGFLPVTGTVRRFRPADVPGVRYDAGIREGSVIGTDYDPMLAKVIAYGDDRETALDRMDLALARTELLGVTTNAAFTRELIAREDVRAGEQDTALLERILDELEPDPLTDELLAAAALVSSGTAYPAGPWRQEYEQGVVRIRDGHVAVGERSFSACVRDIEDGVARVTLDDVARRYAHCTDDDGTIWIARDGRQLEVRPKRRERGAAALAGSLEAPMPGTVLLVNVENGDSVGEGDVLLVIESMKMELSISAPYAGTVEGLELKPGDKVARQQVLVAVTEAE